MNILALGSHPDDIEFGCAGTLLRFSQKGHAVYLMVLTYGEMGGEKEQRCQEQMVSSRILRAQDVFWGGYADTGINLNNGLITHVERVLARIRPDFIFVNYFEDTHQDHRYLAQATISATRYIKNVLFYEVPTTQNFTPNVFVEIGDVLEQKMSSLEAHTSQVLKTNIEDMSISEIARSCANFRGIQGRVKHAEGFVSLRLFVNIPH
ncbi:MAG: hypothetical protein A3G93_02750 [Nitrospinae bacterium RIFCSPLOWO2_12_FULL_45_22]|nr:MAG: hypothetical protein A3G93_02750 [Nitrospinae bacterium RIFCSPLOWO2_12_FULL_45_22]